jgi:hypothetical protein
MPKANRIGTSSYKSAAGFIGLKGSQVGTCRRWRPRLNHRTSQALVPGREQNSEAPRFSVAISTAKAQATYRDRPSQFFVLQHASAALLQVRKGGDIDTYRTREPRL